MSISDWLRTGSTITHDDNPAPKVREVNGGPEDPATSAAWEAAKSAPAVTDRYTDAEFLADVAISALRQGRYELARELTRLAAQAAHMEAAPAARMVPMIGRTRDEQPNTDDACGDPNQPAHAAGTRPSMCATCSEWRIPQLTDAERNAAAAARTEIFGQQDTRAAIAKTARCATEVANGAYLEPCREPVYWHAGNIGDQDNPAVIAGWYHINPALDQDHMPTVDQGAH